jgi:hypothetical protein
MTKVARLRVRIKGTNITALYQPDNIQNQKIMSCARALAEDADTDGFFMVSWDTKGRFREFYNTGTIGPLLSAALVCQIATSELSAAEVFRQRVEWNE